MMRPHVDRRARREPATRQFVSEVVCDSREKHLIACECEMCTAAWSGLTVKQWNGGSGSR